MTAAATSSASAMLWPSLFVNITSVEFASSRRWCRSFSPSPESSQPAGTQGSTDGSGGVPDAENGNDGGRDGPGAQRELVGEERRHVGGEELQGLQREQARVGRGRQRWRDLEYTVPLGMARRA